MNRAIILTACAIAAGVAAAPVAFVASALAQTPAQYRPMADRDHDGIPNTFDNRNDNRERGDRDHDGVPNAYDRSPNNPYRR